MNSTETDSSSPLTYSDLRRLLALIFLIVAAVAFAHAVLPVLQLFAVVFFLALVLNAPVAWLVRHHWKRPLAVVAVMLGLLSVVGLGGLLVGPPLVSQVSGLVENSGTYQKSIEKRINKLTTQYPQLEGAQDILKDWPQKLSQSSTKIVAWVQSFTAALLRGIFFGLIALLVLAFLLLKPQPIVAGFLGALPERHREPARRSLARLMVQMGGWTRATLINGTITGVSVFILFYFIGLPFAFVFGVLAFLGEFVPNLGPVMAALPALFVAASQGPQMVLWTLLAILFVQQVESNVLVPFVMGSALDLQPISIVFFALAMGMLFGLTGAILAVPLAVTTKILWDEFHTRPNNVPLTEIGQQATELVRGEVDVKALTQTSEADDADDADNEEDVEA